MTFKNTAHFTSPQPPSGGDSQDSGIVQPGSPHNTRTTNGSRLNTATTIAAHPTTLRKAPVCPRACGFCKLDEIHDGGGEGEGCTCDSACHSERPLSSHPYNAWTGAIYIMPGFSRVQAAVGK